MQSMTASLRTIFRPGPNAYFNPYVYLPLYYLVRSDLSALEISSALAIVHSILLWLTYELALTVCPFHEPRRRFMFGLCAVAFALVNPILLQQIGSTFADITTGESCWPAGCCSPARYARRALRGSSAPACLCGLAAGLKLTNAVHALAGFAILLCLPLTPWGRIRQGLVYGISLGIGSFVMAAPWSYRLERAVRQSSCSL